MATLNSDNARNYMPNYMFNYISNFFICSKMFKNYVCITKYNFA